MKKQIDYLINDNKKSFDILFNKKIVVKDVRLKEEMIIELIDALNIFIKYRTKDDDNVVIKSDDFDLGIIVSIYDKNGKFINSARYVYENFTL